jgi:hypothetical protein
MLENDKIKKNHCFRIKYELVLHYYMDTIHVLKSLKSRQFLFRKKWDTTPNYIIVIQDLFYIPFEGFVWLVHHCLGLIQSRAELLSHGRTILTIETHTTSTASSALFLDLNLEFNSVLKFMRNGTISILQSYIFQICAAIYQFVCLNC